MFATKLENFCTTKTERIGGGDCYSFSFKEYLYTKSKKLDTSINGTGPNLILPELIRGNIKD